jgi:phenylacetate-coenzyme A ligase PaaK-like adenylate-forming protein
MYSWKPYVETLPRERLRGLELKNFREILRYAKKSSPFYRDMLRGVEPEEVTPGIP